MRKNKLVLIMLLILVTANSWADVKAFLNQSTVYVGDPVTLTIESDNSATVDPDLSVLNKDFQVLGTSQGSSSNFSFNSVDGNTSSYKKTWTIQLAPKQRGKKGQIEIPIIRLGNESTLPLTLTIAELTPEIVSQNSQHVTLEASVEIGQSLPYVQQQIPYVIRLYTDETIKSGDLFAPNIKNAVVEKLSRDKQNTIIRKGKKINVLERHYVISPEKSGKLIIPPAIFKGKQVLPNANSNQRSRRGGFADDFFNDPFFSGSFFGGQAGTSVTTRSDSIEIDVQSIPAKYKGKNWLPAEDLVVIDSWKKSSPTFKVGEPVVRTLTLQTKGLTGSQIPEFPVATPEKIRVYPDKSVTETRTDGKTVIGLRQQSMSYIPNAAGKVIIPAVSIDWWNVVSKAQESFTLPAREIQILAGVASSEQQEPLGKNTITAADNAKQPKEQVGLQKEPSESNKWLWGLLILGALSALVFFGFRYLNKQTKPANTSLATTHSKLNSSAILNRLGQACNDNDRRLVATLLLQLAEAEWPNNAPKSLGVLADRVENGAELIRALDKSLYADSHSNDADVWEGRHLWEVVQSGLQSTSRKKDSKNEGVAASLYPDRRSRL